MKIFSISDLHLSINSSKPMDIFGPVWEGSFEKIAEDWQRKVTDDDVVLLCGDLSWAMKDVDAIEDINLLSKLPGKKIIIKGNHDYWWQGITKLRNMLPENFYVLQNDAMKIENVVFCGTRDWLIPEGKFKTEENERIYAREFERLKLTLADAARKREDGDLLVCLMHYPPFLQNEKATEFTKLFHEYGVDIVVFGHIHKNLSGYRLFCNIDGIDYYLTSCDLLNNCLVEIKI